MWGVEPEYGVRFGHSQHRYVWRFAPDELRRRFGSTSITGGIDRAASGFVARGCDCRELTNFAIRGRFESMGTTMNISLPEALRDFVEDAVDTGSYSSVSEYVRELVRQAKTEKELEERLLAALDSADLGPIGPEFFEGLKARAKKAARGRG